MSVPPCELLIHTAVSLIYQQFFSGRLGLDIGFPSVPGRLIAEATNGTATVQAYVCAPGLKKPRKHRKKQVDPALEQLLLTNDEPALVIKTPKKRPGKIRYTDLILEGELRDVEDTKLLAKSMVAELVIEPKKKRKREALDWKPEVTLQTGEALKPGKQRKFTKILGVMKAEYSTMRTVHIPTAVEVVPEEPNEDTQNGGKEVRERLPYRLVRCRTWSVRPESACTFESFRIQI